MTWLRIIGSRILAVVTRRRLDHDFNDELAYHLESLTEEYEAAGLSRAESRRRAVLKLGHPQQLREDNRVHRGMALLESLAQDSGYALRTLRQSSGFTSVAVLTMALGIGLCAFLFSFLNGFVLRPLPGARDPGRLAAMQEAVSYPYFERYRDANAVVRRRKEIGIRMALGAQRRQVLRLVMKEGAAMMLVGSALGIAGAGVLVRILLWVSASFGPINPSFIGPLQTLGGPLLLVAVALVACYLPARKSATIYPLAAL